jgi:hypothetical protein
MKRAIKVMGIIAVVALISFSFFGCGDPEETESLGRITIIVPDGTPGNGTEFDVWPLGTELETDCTKAEATFQWQTSESEKVGEGEEAYLKWSTWFDVEDDGTGPTYEPSKAGRYRVVVTLGDEKSNGQEVFIGERVSVVTPVDPPTPDATDPKAKFYGTWVYDQNDPLSDNTTPARKNLKQTITISATSFALVEDEGTDSLRSTSNFTWHAITTKPVHTNPNTPSSDPYIRSKYDAAFPTANGYRVTSGWSAMGYPFPTSSGFYIYLSDDGKRMVRTNNSNAYVTCVYVKED